jgi:Terminase large subunit, ATPase domain
VNEAVDLLYALVLEDGRRWGEAAVDVQRADAEAVLDTGSETPNHMLTRSRGYSKTSDLAGVSIPVMLVQAPARARMYGLAADRGQGQLLVDAIAGFVQRTPELRNALIVREWEVVAARSGAKLEILPADQASIWGLRPYFVVVDELAQWHATGPPERCWQAVSSAAVKVPGCRLVVLTTAGDPAHWSRRVLDDAYDDALWRVCETRGPAPWLDTKRLEGERRRLPESVYRRLFENEWVAGEDRLASPDDLRECVTLEGPLEPQPGVRYVLGLDVGLKSDATVAAVCHAERNGAVRVVLDRMQHISVTVQAGQACSSGSCSVAGPGPLGESRERRRSGSHLPLSTLLRCRTR